MSHYEITDIRSALHPLPEGDGGLPPDYYAEINYLSAMEASPQRTKLAWIQSRLDLDGNRLVQDMHLLKDDRNLRLTASGDVSKFVWLSDEELLFVSRSRDDAPANRIKDKQVWYRIHTDGGEAQPYLTFSEPVNSLYPLGDERFLCLREEDARWPLETPPELRRAVEKQRSAYRYIEHQPFYFNGSGWTDHTIRRLYLFDRSRNTMQRLSDPAYDVQAYAVHDDGSRAAFVAARRFTRQALSTALFEVELDSLKTEERRPADGWILDDPFYWGDDLAVFALDPGNFGLSRNHRPAFVKDELRFITDEICVNNALGTDLRQGARSYYRVAEDRLYLLQTRSDRVVLEAIERDGTRRVVVGDVDSVEDFDFLEDLYVSAFTPEQPANLYRLPAAKLAERLRGEPVRRSVAELCGRPRNDEDLLPVLSLNPPSGAEPARRLKYESGGLPMEGWVLLPEAYRADGKSPAILCVHGGPKTIYGPVLYHEMQYWVSQGYVVFYTNPRGSAGRGDAFADLAGLYGSVDYDDLMKFTDEVLAAYPGIDPERLGMTGGSYGGYMANLILSRTDRFAAIVTQRSICNWLSFYGTSDIGYYFTPDQHGLAMQDENFPLKLWDFSPLKHIDRAKTPTLIIHSEQDYRCPVEQAYQLYNALIDRGVPTALLLFHEENHDLSRTGKPQMRRQRLAAITQWMNHYLKGEPLIDSLALNRTILNEREDHVDNKA